MKCEWKEVKLQDIALELSDGLHKAPIFYPDGEYIFVNATNIENGRIVEKDPSKKTNLEEFLKYGVELTDRTILYSIDGTIGNIAKYRGEKCLLGKGACYITLDDSVDVDYIYYLLQSPIFNEYIHIMSTGSTIRHISLKTMRNFTFQLPPIEHQKAIGNVLSSIDNKIEINNKINENLQQQAQAIFKSWFVDFEPFQDGEFVESELGTIPVEFTITRTGRLPLIVTDYVANGSFASLKANVHLYQERNYAYFIRNTDLKSGGFKVFVDEHSYNFLSKSRLQGGEIIISNVGDVGSVFLCPVLDAPMTLGNNMIMLKPECQELQYYLYIWFKYSLGQNLIQGIKSGSAQPKFNKTDFKSLPIVLPPDKILQEFHELVSPIFKLVEKNQVENRKIAMLRDVLLPKLMNGEIEINGI